MVVYRHTECQRLPRQSQSSYNTLSHQLPDPRSPLLTKHRHSCVQSPRMLTKPSLHTTHIPTDTPSHTGTPSTQMQNKTKPSPSGTSSSGHMHTGAGAHRRDEPAVTLLSTHPSCTPPSQSGLTSSHAVPQLFWGGHGRLLLLGGSGEQSRRCQKCRGCQRGRLYPYAWAPHTKSSCQERRPPWAQSCAEAAAAQLIELGWPGPATRAPPAVRSASSPGATQARTGCRGMD